MICEKIFGKIEDFDPTGKKIEYIDIEWAESTKKVHRKQTESGLEVGLRMDDSVLVRGLYEGDVIYADDQMIIAVHTPACEVIKIHVHRDHAFMVAKVCYEIGNRHAPLFYGHDDFSFVTPYDEPMLVMLKKMHGIDVERAVEKLDFEHRVSASIHHHHH